MINTFEDFINASYQNDPAEIVSIGQCPECKKSMIVVSTTEYLCECGHWEDGFEKEPVVHGDGGGSLRVQGNGKTRYYNASGDYSTLQKKTLEDHLAQRVALYKGTPFPKNVIASAISKYNCVQKNIKQEIINPATGVIEQKKFVRRGSIKDEMLAALIYYEGIRAGITRKKPDVAALMGLQTSGFSHGEDIVRTLVAQQIIDLPIDLETPEGYVVRYLELLGIDPRWTGFVIEMYEVSERVRIGYQTLMTTKLVAFIWLINEQAKLGFTKEIVERSCDNIRGNTFMKFYAVIWTYLPVFARTMKTYGLSWDRV